MPSFIDEPGLFAQFVMVILDWIHSKFGHKLSFGEMLLGFEAEAQLEKRLIDKGFVFKYA